MTIAMRAPGAPLVSEAALDAVTNHMLDAARRQIEQLAPEAMSGRGRTDVVLLVSEPHLVDLDGAPASSIARFDALAPGEPFVDALPARTVIAGLRMHPKFPREVTDAIAAQVRLPLPANAVRIVLLHSLGVNIVAGVLRPGGHALSPALAAANAPTPSLMFAPIGRSSTKRGAPS